MFVLRSVAGYTLILAFAVVTVLSPATAADKKASVLGDSAASANGLRVPVVTYLAQNSQLRPVIGSVGASVLGDSISLPDGATRIVMSPLGSFALVERSDDQPLSVMLVASDGAGAMQPVTGALVQSDRIEFSASGATAALYSASRQRVQVVTNLPGSPVLQEFDVSSLTAAVISMAVSDDATVLLLGISDGQSGGVYRITQDHALVSVLTTAAPSALRLIPDSDAALVGDSQLNQILLLSQVSGTPVSKQLAGGDNGVNGPSQIEVLADNRTAVIANLNASSLLFIDLQLATSSSVSIFAPAVSLRSIGKRTGLTFSTAAPTAYWLVSGGSDTPVITLIADLAASASAQ